MSSDDLSKRAVKLSSQPEGGDSSATNDSFHDDEGVDDTAAAAGLIVGTSSREASWSPDREEDAGIPTQVGGHIFVSRSLACANENLYF